ncbi:MAG: lipid A biosynthesis acyltransferase [Flavobacteriaceae bacterium]|nr:lipid A biosynthesis acyltransferase [Flavobacteriaceae bacterium]
MTQWEGKSRGTVTGYKIFIYLMEKLGVVAAYGLLVFVAFYFFLFSYYGSKSIYYYFRKRLGYGFWKSFVSIYKSYFVFGQTIIDKVAISSGLRDYFTYEFDGIDHIKALLREKKGGVLISAHIGNFEIANKFFAEIDIESSIYIVTTDAEHEKLQQYLDGVTGKSQVKTIIVREDMSHIFEIHHALDSNGLVCFTGDRYFEGSKTIQADLLGEKAKFPVGPFLLSSRLQAPVLFVYVMKETNKHYHLYARQAQFKRRDSQGLLEEYCKSIEGILARYPLQWFNYFDFWQANSKN